MDLTDFESLWQDIDPKLKEYRDEVTALRASVSSPGYAESLDKVHDRLKDARRAQDRVEYIMAQVGLMRSRIRKLVADLQEQYEEAWRNTMHASRTGEYDSAKEKNARYDLGALREKISLHRAKQLQFDVEEVYDYVVIKHRGLEAVRTDARGSLRIVEFESTYER